MMPLKKRKNGRYSYNKHVSSVTFNGSPLLSLLVFTAVLCACQRQTPTTVVTSDIETDAAYDIESWGPFEHTHETYVSVMASKACPRESDTVKYIDPLPKLTELARQHNVVMINEAHYKPLHRAFIGELAKSLRQNGFTHLGAETFSVSKFSDDDRNAKLMSRGYPVRTDGFYSKEPIYGQLIETLIESDYELFAYESNAPLPKDAFSGIAHRDSDQAKNILNEIGGDQNKRVLIHAGFDHIRERLGTRDKKWMAQYFKESSGINPLTISQTDCFSDTAFDAGALGYAMPVDLDGNLVTYDGFDVLLIPPKEAQYKERPVWLNTSQGRSFVDVPLTLQFDDQYTRVTAYNVKRIKDAVAEDMIYRAPHADKPLALRQGTYRIEVTDKDKMILAKDIVIVP